MAFLKFDNWKKLNPALATALALSDEKFKEIEALAAVQITDVSGLVNPADADDAPTWVTVPAANIIDFYLIRGLSEATIEEREFYRALHDKALKTLANHKEVNVTSGIVMVKIEEKYTL